MSDKYCRICLSNDDSMIPFLSSVMVIKEEIPINDMFNSILGNSEVNEEPGDTVQYICEHCVLSLKQAYLFKVLCCLSQEYKRKYLRPPIPESYIVVDDCAVDVDDNSATQRRLRSSNNICTICNKTFGNKSSLKLHEQTHNCDRLLHCNICNRVFRNSTTLTQHLNIYHTQCQQCDKCTRNFKTQQSLDLHKKTHCSLKYICSTCRKGFSTAAMLTAHSRLHLKKENYVCLICGKSFPKQVLLTVHKCRANVCQTYSCKKCGKNLSNSAQMKKHTHEKTSSRK